MMARGRDFEDDLEYIISSLRRGERWVSLAGFPRPGYFLRPLLLSVERCSDCNPSTCSHTLDSAKFFNAMIYRTITSD